MQNGSTRRNNTHEELLPSRIDSLRDHEIVDIIAGDSHSLAIDSTGTLYSWFTSYCFANLLVFKLIVRLVCFLLIFNIGHVLQGEKPRRAVGLGINQDRR